MKKLNQTLKLANIMKLYDAYLKGKNKKYIFIRFLTMRKFVRILHAIPSIYCTLY